MKIKRFLLPFTHGIDMCALEQAIRFAKGCDATLVPLALIRITQERQRKGVRLEHIQQSKDFLEAVNHKAARFGVPIERFEIFTSDVVQSINTFATEIECEGILLFIGGESGILLEISEIKRLMEMGSCKLYVLHMSANTGKKHLEQLHKLVSNWLAKNRKQQDVLLEAQNCSGGETDQPMDEATQPVEVVNTR